MSKTAEARADRPRTLEDLFTSIKRFADYEVRLNTASGGMGRVYRDIQRFDRTSTYARALKDFERNPIVQPTSEWQDAPGGHPILRPDGTEIRLPAWAVGMLRHLQLVLDEPGKPPQLNAGAYLVAGNPEHLLKEIVRYQQRPGRKNEAHRGGGDREIVVSADLPAACYHGYGPEAMGRLARVLGPDLSGPGERLSCNCPKCRLCS